MKRLYPSSSCNEKPSVIPGCTRCPSTDYKQMVWQMVTLFLKFTEGDGRVLVLAVVGEDHGHVPNHMAPGPMCTQTWYVMHYSQMV